MTTKHFAPINETDSHLICEWVFRCCVFIPLSTSGLMNEFANCNASTSTLENNEHLYNTFYYCCCFYSSNMRNLNYWRTEKNKCNHLRRKIASCWWQKFQIWNALGIDSMFSLSICFVFCAAAAAVFSIITHRCIHTASTQRSSHDIFSLMATCTI